MAKAKNPRSTPPRSKNAVNQPAVAETQKPALEVTAKPGASTMESVADKPRTPVEVAPRSGVSRPVDMESEIRARAYQLYQERGGTPGHQHEDWARAEREITARSQHQRSA